MGRGGAGHTEEAGHPCDTPGPGCAPGHPTRMSQTRYESRLPNAFAFTDPGPEVLLVQTESGVPVGSGRDHEVEVTLGLYPDKAAAMTALKQRGS
jgi:hypothetical protein